MTPCSRTPFAGACAAAVLAGLLAGAGEAAAQDPGPPPGLEVAVSGVVLTPLAELTSTPTFATEVSTALGGAGTVTLWFGRNIGLMAQGVWAPAELSVRPSEFTGPIPRGLGDADYAAGTAAIAYRLALPGALSSVEPYFGVGGGVRHLSLDAQAAPDAEDASDPVGTVVAGASTRVWPSVAVRLELRDLVSSYESPLTGESRLQNDLLVSVGAAVRP